MRKKRKEWGIAAYVLGKSVRSGGAQKKDGGNVCHLIIDPLFGSWRRGMSL